MTREPVLPAVRAAMFTAVCVSLAVVAHRTMSDAAIPPWAVVVAGVGVYAPARLGVRRECGLLGISALMAALQVVMHLLFSYAQGVAAPGSSAASMSMPGMSMSAGSSMPMPMHSASVPIAAVGGGMRMGAGMLLAHAAAAVICAWWLRRGESAVHALVRGAGKWILRHLVPVLAVLVLVPDEKPFASRAEPVALALRAQWLLTTRALRGPPVAPSFT